MTEDYKKSEDNKQEQYLDHFNKNSNEMLTSCRHLSRRMLHSWNRYSYTCEADDADGCPKGGGGRKGVADKSCLCDPYDMSPWTLSGDNNEQDDFADK